jgi:hypothetical protein
MNAVPDKRKPRDVVEPDDHRGPRLYVKGLRIHHGAVGALLTIVGAVLTAHDWRDFPWPLKDPREGH